MTSLEVHKELLFTKALSLIRLNLTASLRRQVHALN